MDKRKIILEILQYSTDLMEAENGTGLYIANLDEVADELVKKLNIDDVSKCLKFVPSKNSEFYCAKCDELKEFHEEY